MIREGALKLLAEAGWQRQRRGWLEKDGKRLQFTLITNSGNDLRKAILAIAQDAWKQIGIDVRTDLLEWSVFIQERVNKWISTPWCWGGRWASIRTSIRSGIPARPIPYQLNFVGFKNAEADDLIIKIRQEYNHESRWHYCHRLHEIIADEQPYTFLYVGKWTAVLDKRIVIKAVNDAAATRSLYKKINADQDRATTCLLLQQMDQAAQVPEFTCEG